MWGRQPGEEGPGSGTLRKQNTVDWVGGVDGRGARMEVGWWGSLVVIADATTAGRGAGRRHNLTIKKGFTNEMRLIKID